TTVFNALTRGRVDTAPLGGQAGKPNVGVAKVPDPRLNVLTSLFQPERVVPAEVLYVDIPGAPEGMGKSQGIGGEYLNRLQRSDALVLVIRAFQDPSVPHLEGSVDPYRDAATMNMELSFSDLAILERRSHTLEVELKGAKVQERERIRHEASLIDRLRASLEKDIPLREQELSNEERHIISGYQFLTAKPLLILFNLGEEQLPQAPEVDTEMSSRLNRPGVLTATMCAKLEEDLSQMGGEEEEEFRRSLGAGEPGYARMIRFSYQMLGLISFFTTGPDEVRAWTIRQGTPAVKAAGQIHTDMERGFIRAEVVSFDDLALCGSIAEVRRKGRLRLEGKTYTVKDGDVITFLFNV
ncbi:MAG: redox-regulated ATPase YchF, partial [Chloroflexota bacterium]